MLKRIGEIGAALAGLTCLALAIPTLIKKGDVMTNITSHQPTLACDLTAIPVEQKEGYQTAVQLLQASIQERQELPNGYAFRFPVEPQLSAKVLEFIAAERRCCSFLTFTLEFKPEGGPLWLQITGPEGTKQFLAENFS